MMMLEISVLKAISSVACNRAAVEGLDQLVIKIY